MAVFSLETFTRDARNYRVLDPVDAQALNNRPEAGIVR
jgi:hypothetical protein